MVTACIAVVILAVFVSLSRGEGHSRAVIAVPTKDKELELLCLDDRAASCLTPSFDLWESFPDPRACDGVGRRVCIVPMGAVAPSLIDDLVQHFETEYGLRLHVRRAIDFGKIPRPRFTTDAAVRWMSNQVSRYAQDPDVILIGILPFDLYLPSQSEDGWVFGQTFGYRDGESVIPNHAVVSTFRMDQRVWGYPRNDKVLSTRLRKMVGKYVATLYYMIPISDYPNSITYGSISGLGDLDRITDRIPVPR